MTKPLRQYKIQKSKTKTQKPTKMFDYKAIADRLRTVSWSNFSHPTGVVNPFMSLTFHHTVTAVLSKGHISSIHFKP